MDNIRVLEDIYLLDFFERKSNTIIPAAFNNLRNLARKFKCQREYSGGDYFINESLKKNYSLIYDILLAAEGKMSLCGICVIHIVKYHTRIKQFDFYIHSCDRSTANNLIYTCFQILGNNIVLTEDYIDIFVESISIVVRIFFTIYTNREEILLNIGPAPEKHGWDLITGYFSTVNGILALTTKEFPIYMFPNTRRLALYAFMDITPVSHTTITSLPSVKDIVGHVEIYNYLSKQTYYKAAYERNDYSFPNELAADLIYLTVGDIDNLTRLYKHINKRLLNPRLCFGNNYDTLTVGISNDRYVAFACCRVKFNLTNDVFSLLCFHWLSAESMLARDRLLN